MKQAKHGIISRLMSGLILALLIGCTGATAPVQFYTLSLPEPSVETPGSGKRPDSVSLGVGPLEIPKMIDRPQIVTRGDGNKLRVDEFHRWGGALDEDILRVLAEHLSGMLKSNRVMAHPWADYFQPDYRIHLIFHRFDGRFGNSLLLNCTWTVTDAKGRQELAVRRSVIRKPLATDNYERLVFAASQALEELSRQIAKEIEGQVAK